MINGAMQSRKHGINAMTNIAELMGQRDFQFAHIIAFSLLVHGLYQTV